MRLRLRGAIWLALTSGTLIHFPQHWRWLRSYSERRSSRHSARRSKRCAVRWWRHWSMSRLLALGLLAALVISAQEPRQIMEEVQRRQRSDSQHYEGTLEVLGNGNRIA